MKAAEQKVTELMSALKLEVRRTGQQTTMSQLERVNKAADAVLDAQEVTQEPRARHVARLELVASVVGPVE